LQRRRLAALGAARARHLLLAQAVLARRSDAGGVLDPRSSQSSPARRPDRLIGALGPVHGGRHAPPVPAGPVQARRSARRASTTSATAPMPLRNLAVALGLCSITSTRSASRSRSQRRAR